MKGETKENYFILGGQMSKNTNRPKSTEEPSRFLFGTFIRVITWLGGHIRSKY